MRLPLNILMRIDSINRLMMKKPLLKKCVPVDAEGHKEIPYLFAKIKLNNTFLGQESSSISILSGKC